MQVALYVGFWFSRDNQLQAVALFLFKVIKIVIFEVI